MTPTERGNKAADEIFVKGQVMHRGWCAKIIADAIRDAVAEEQTFWENLMDKARGVLCEVFLADDLTEQARRNKARHCYEKIVAAIKASERE